jgi:mitochondrial chaperone BCS1
MSDNTLTQLMGHLPTRCIVLLEDLDASFTHSTTRDKKSTGVPTAPTSSQATESDGSSLTLSGLLNAIDGVTAPEGRILFATTNHIDRLDEALRRPGRMDVWINFKHATQWQAEGIFKRFFPCKPKIVSGNDTPMGSEASAATTNPGATLSEGVNAGIKKKRTSVHAAPVLEEDELAALAKRFAEQIPENEVSVAGLQGFLLKNKSRPRECVDEVAAWVVEESERREKLKKEKAEKEKKEKEEEEKKEKEEKEAKDKEKEKESADDLAAARKAYRKAKRAAAAAVTTTEEPSVTADKADSSSEESSSEEAPSSSSEEDKKVKRKKRKEKWVAVKKESANAEPAADATKSEEVEPVEDTSAVDALVDAATKTSSAPDAPAEPSTST